MSKQADKPWERQERESDKAYAAFVAYRDMGEKRSIRAVAKALSKSSTIIKRWSATWSWVERVRAYENEMDREARKKAIADRRAMTERHIGIAMQLQKKALEALGSISPEDMSAKDVKEILKMATELERLNRSQEEQEAKGGSDRPAQLADAIVLAYQKRKEEGNA